MTWRLLEDGPARGAWNMAVDQAIWRAVAQNQSAPTLRFYSWQPFCLSVGRLQKQLPPSVESGDFDFVRRPTGGRAVWHAQEITYSICVRLDDLPPENRSVNGAYQFLSAGFIRGLGTLGLETELASQGVKTDGSNCFAASAACDFLARGKKLIGAAQCRDEQALLQHGSLLLSIDRASWEKTAGGGIENAISLEELGAARFSQAQIQKALSLGLAGQTGATFEAGKLSKSETRLAEILESEKYLSSAWNRHGQIG